MATVSALHAVTSGLAQYLGRAYQLRPIGDLGCTFSAVGTSEFKKLDGQTTTCSIFPYRVTHNEHLRNRVPPRRTSLLTVDLHLLFTVWADSALREQSLIAWVLRELHQHAVLSNGILAGVGGFDAADAVQLLTHELSIDEMTKLWQVLTPPYRASLTYVARNVPIDVDPPQTFAPVVATRFELRDEVESMVPP